MTDKHTILVVDDEDALRQTICAELTDAGLNVDSANDGDKAIEIIKQKKFELVLLDVRMPTLNGIEVLKFISQNYPTTKVIMLTALDDVKTALAAKQYGAYNFVAKPYDLEDLLIIIHEALGDPSPK